MTKAPELLQSRNILDYADHNAFTDLIRFNDRFFCIFREGSGYVPGTNGKIPVIVSDDGFKWTPLRRVKGIPFNNWFFRITWHNDTGYLVPSICGADPKTGRVRREERKLVLFKTDDGKNLTGLSKSA